MALDNGRILAGGAVSGSPGAFLLARYQASGAPDTAWGNNGVITAAIPGGDAVSWDMALQADGKILLAGYVRPSGGGSDFALIRYNPDGSLDAGFGSGGIVTQTLGASDYAYGVLVQSDGKIVLGGLAGTSPAAGGVARYNADGSYDNSFGSAASLNYITTTVPGYASTSFIETALRADDGIVAALRVGSGSPSVTGIAVFDKNGRPNSFIAPNGVITTSNNGRNVSNYALLTQPDGKIVLAGHVDMDDTSGYQYDLALWRYILRGEVYLPIVTR